MTLVTNPKEKEGPKLCASDLEMSIRHLTGLTVRVTGQWRLSKAGDKECFEAQDFTILSCSSGRSPVVGLLVREGDYFKVIRVDGSEVQLKDLPDGLKSMIGRKVILDIKAMSSTTVVDAAKVVVEYRLYP